MLKFSTGLTPLDSARSGPSWYFLHRLTASAANGSGFPSSLPRKSSAIRHPAFASTWLAEDFRSTLATYQACDSNTDQLHDGDSLANPRLIFRELPRAIARAQEVQLEMSVM